MEKAHVAAGGPFCGQIFGRFYTVLSVAAQIFGHFYAVLPVTASKIGFLSVIIDNGSPSFFHVCKGLIRFLTSFYFSGSFVSFILGCVRSIH